MGKLKKWIKRKLMNVVRCAIREEFSENRSLNLLEAKSFDQFEDEIVKRLDKQIERWTWERYKRTDNLFDILGYDLRNDMDKGLVKLQKNIEISNAKNIDEKIKYWTAKRFEQTDKQIEHWTDEKTKYWTARRFEQTDKQIERWTWERYKRSEDKLLYVYKLQNQLSQILFNENKVSYNKGEKIRIIFLFQVASFWPSWESFYDSCRSDPRMDVKFLFLDETVREAVQMKSAKEFLDANGIEYINFCDFDIDEFKPHVIVIQTPYDAGHRIKAHWSSAWKAKGYRVVYIPYGIEISDTDTSHGMHFEQHVVENAWRVYTFSETMLRDYRKYCINSHSVRALGHPKFDSLYHKENFKLDDELLQRINGRKICLWKVHFPKIFEEKGKDIFVTPDLNEYIKFAEYAAEHNEIFFIFMPHPRFEEPVKNKNLQQLAIRLMDTLEDKENVYIDKKDDYRYSLLNSDFIIIDRSAVMVEAAAVGAPILYMVNSAFYEPVTKAIEPLMNSYEQGSVCDDMIEFVENCMNGIDKNKELREEAFKQCMPYFDGKCGERIKEDIIKDLMDNYKIPGGNIAMKNMNILMCSSKEFSMATYVIIQSFIENNPDYKIKFFFAATDIIDDAEKIKEFTERQGHEFIFIHLDVDFFLQFKTQNKWTHVTYMKLMMHEYLPEDVDRVLYVDMDAICNGSIEEFYEIDFGDNYIAACSNSVDPKKIEECNNITEINETLAVNGNYFNAGIVLFNLEKIRKEISTQMIIDAYEFCVQRASRYVADQSILNCLYCSKTKYLNSLDYNYRISCEFSDQRNLYNNPKMAIIHYISQNMPYKPWDLLLNDEDIANIIGMPFEWGYIYISKKVIDLINIWWKYAKKTPIYDTLRYNAKIKREWFMVYGVTAINMITRELNKNKAMKRRCAYIDEQKTNIALIQNKNNCTFLEALDQYWGNAYDIDTAFADLLDIEDNIFAYLKKLYAQNDEFILLMSVYHTAVGHWSEFLKLQDIGLTRQLRHCEGYCAICSTKDKNLFFEKSGRDLQKLDYILDGNAKINIGSGDKNKMILEIDSKKATYFTCISKGYDAKLNTVRSQILINNIDYGMNKRGLNVVVYNASKYIVADVFNVDVHGDDEFKINRNI